MVSARTRSFVIRKSKFIIRFFRWLTKTPRRKTAWVLLVAYLINQFVYPLVPFLKDNTVHANGVIEPVALGTSLFVNRNPEFNVWFGDRLDQSKHKIVFEVSGHEIELRLQGASSQELASSDEIDQLIANLRKELQKPILTAVDNKDALDQKIADRATIRYEILPDRGVKESILIEDKTAVTNQYVFEMKLSNGVQLKSKLENLNNTQLNATSSSYMLTPNSYYFTDNKGKYLANFEPLVMIDAAGAKSNDISLSITPNTTPLSPSYVGGGVRQDGGGIGCLLASCYTLTLTANQTWLNAPERVYPVNLDPTIVHEQNPDFSSGTENRSQVTGTGTVETQYKELQTDINTVGLWHFNEGSGTTAYDASGNNNTGTLTNGPVWNGPTDTLVGLGKSSLYFDGVNDYVTSGTTNMSTSSMTWSAWIYPTAASQGGIMSYDNGTSDHSIRLYFTSANKIAMGIGWVTDYTSNTALVLNTWNHVAMTKSSGSWILYINGAQDITASDSSASVLNSFQIGRFYNGASWIYFTGRIDEVRVSNIARTPEEIAASASRYPYAVHESPVIDFGSTPNTLDSLTYSATGVRTGDGETPYSRDGLVAQWNFNETSGTTAYNTAGSDSCSGTPSSCNGTLTSFASTSSQDQAAGTGWTANNKRWGAGALMTDGTNDYSLVADNANLDTFTAFSLDTWVKFGKLGAAQTIASKYGNAAADQAYQLQINASNQITWLTGTSSNITTTSNSKINDGNWHYLVGTYDGANQYLYIDGKLDNNSAQSGTVKNSAVGLTVGSDLSGASNAAANFLTGTVDATRLYSRALTATEILSNYQSGNIEFQTRTGATSTPNDGTWETWRTTSGTGDTQIDSLDNVVGVATPSASIWQGVPIATSSGSIKMEGTNSLRAKVGAPQVDGNTVALWHMDETSGSGAYIKDSTANAYNATPTGSTVVDGFYGKGRSFNGSSDYLEVASGTAFGFSGDFTYSAWIKTTQTSSGMFMSFEPSAGSTGAYLSVNVSTANKMLCGTFAGGVNTNVESTSNVNDGKWHHVACVRSGTNHYAYIDGALEATTNSTVRNFSGTSVFRLGNRVGSTSYFNGSLDEPLVKNVAMTADEVAEAYRAGRDHRISTTITSTDLSSKTKLPFYVASDRPGTFLEATVGESAYANYEPDANTVGLWHLDEAAGSGAYIKDSSGNGNNGTPTGTTFVQGKIGKGRKFASNSDYIMYNKNIGTLMGSDNTGSVDGWAYLTATSTNDQYITADYNSSGTNDSVDLLAASPGTCTSSYPMFVVRNASGTKVNLCGTSVLSLNTWHHIAGTYNGTTMSLYVDGVLVATASQTGNFYAGTADGAIGRAGAYNSASIYVSGSIDEVRIDSSTRTADEIRQAYEIGKRTHPITVDFKADLDSSNLIANTSDLSFAIQPDVDVNNNSLNIAKGEKIIVKENVGGTEYISQGTVSAVTYEANTSNPNAWSQDQTSNTVTSVTVTSWDSGSTAPAGGFTTAATVFKWQREYFDLTQIPLSTQRDGITRITLRVTDGSQGANVWLDDFESAAYSSASRITIGSTAQRYFQYRTILTSPNAQTSPTLTNVNINYNSGTTAQAPKTKDASSDFTATGASLNRLTDTGSGNSPSLELAYKELPVDNNTQALWRFNESSGNASDNSANANTLTASGTTIATGKLNNTRTFNGTSDYLYKDSSVSGIGGSTQMTYEAWIKRTATGNADSIYALGNVSVYKYQLLRILADNTIRADFGNDANTDFAICATTATYTDTTNWHHIAATYLSGKVKIYLDGVEQSCTAGGTWTGAVVTETTYLRVGSYWNGANGGYFHGSIDEVRISNIARTPEEIKLDAQRRPYGVYTSDPIKLPSNVSSLDNLRWTENGVQTGDGETPYSTNGLVAQWNFNETSGTTAADSTTNKTNLTLNNFASTGSQDAAAGSGWTKDNRKWGAGAIMLSSAATADTLTASDPASNLLDPNSADLTIGMWVKTQDTTAELLSNNANNGTACTNNGYYLGIDASGYPVFYLDTNGATAGCDAQISSLTTGKINDGNWHYLSVSVTRGTSALMYLDGVQIGSDLSVTSYSAITVAGSIQIASNANYDGSLDAIQVYSRALSAVEVQSNYNNGNVEFQTRTGATSTPNDGTWEDWKPSGNSTEVQLGSLDGATLSGTIPNCKGLYHFENNGNADSACGSNLTTTGTITYSTARPTPRAGTYAASGFSTANYYTIPNAVLPAMTTGTVEFFWAPGSLSANQYVFYATDGTNASYFYVDTSGVIHFKIGSGAEITSTASLNQFPTLAAWYHLATTWDGTNWIIYKDGVQINSTAKTQTLAASTTAYLGINTGPASPLTGSIDEFRVVNSALSASQIAQDAYLNNYSHGVAATVPISQSTDTTTKFEGTGSEKITIGAPQVDSTTVALWHMDETSGSGAYIKDSTANANHGTPTGTTVVDGFYGKGRSFNGSSYITVGSGSSVNLTNTLSVSAWIKSNDTACTGGMAIFIGQNNGYGFMLNGTTCKLDLTKAGVSDVAATNAAITDTKWHHVAVTYNASNANFYLDGVLDSSPAYTATFSTGLTYYIGGRGDTHFNGIIDEVQVSNVVRSADEIAEAYRAGRDHRVSTSLTSTDLTSKTKLPFYVASDRPGTFLEATVGESALVNYEAGDPDLKGLWHLDENSNGSAAVTRKDSSGNGNDLTDNNTTTSAQGKIGKSGQFTAANSEYLSIADNASLSTGDIDFTISAWVYADSFGENKYAVTKVGGTDDHRFIYYRNASSKFAFSPDGETTIVTADALGTPTTGTWYYVVVYHNATANQIGISVNNGPFTTASFSGGLTDSTGTFRIGTYNGTGNYWNGKIDEVMMIKRVLTPDEIRQAYEVGKRSHQITNDFVTSPQAAYSSGTSVTINNPYGTTNLTDTLSIGDTMIFKENVAGTETVSQAVVTNIANTSSTYGTVTLLAAPTFPSGGYTTAAKVFKWQREWFDTSTSLSTSRDAINRITLRVTDGSQGANVWIDDIKAAGPYLSNPTTRSSTITSTPNTYVQYRAIISTTDTAVSPTLTAISLQFHTQPKKITGSDTLGAQGSLDKDGNVHLGSNNVKKVAFYDRTKDQISYALDFDNTNDYVAVGTGPTSVKTVEFWVNPNSTSTEFIDLNGSAYINVASGTVTATGFTSPTIYVNGNASTTLSANQWSHIAVTTGTGLNATALNFGKRSTSYFNGQMDEVALYSAALTALQVTTDYNNRRLAGTETNLVALYHFDEGQGTRAYDSIGGFHGTLTNMAATAWVNSQNDRDQSALSQQTLGVDPNWGNGPVRESYGLKYNNSSNFTTIPDSASLSITGTMTIEGWYSFGSFANYDPIISKGDADRTFAGATYYMRLNSAGQIYWSVQDDNTNCGIRRFSATNLSTNTTYHIVGTYDGGTAATGLHIYVNGKLDDGTTDAPGGCFAAVRDTTGDVLLGKVIDAGANDWGDVTIDEVAIFNTERTATQISSDYANRRFKGNETGLAGLWHMDEGADNLCSGGTNDACDASSNGNDGASTSSPTWVTDARAVMDNNARYISLGSSSSSALNKGMEIYAISTTQFKYRWTGDQTWSSAVNFSSYPFATPAQLGTTGVYVGFDTTNGTFGDESYFLIPSWAIEQFSSTRGARRSFPERSYLVATDRSVDIIDADDNTLWMRTSNGVSGQLLGTQTLNVPSSVTMAHGQLLIGTNGSSGTGAYRLDFNRDVAYRYNATNRTTGNNNIAKRNATDWSWGSADTGQNLIDSIVNDVSLLTSNGRLVMGTANNTGLTKIANIMSNDTSYDYSDVTSNSYNRVKMAENYLSGTGAVGDMYALNSTNNALERWNNVVADVADKVNGTPDATVNATSTPALFASAQTVNDLDVKTGTSLASAGNNTVYVGHNGGTTVFQENRATLASSSVKYYTKDYIGEEMVGDIKAYWPLNADNTSSDLEDVSIGAKNLTATNITSADAVTGVRNKATDFDGSTEYLTASATVVPVGAKSVGFWMKTTQTSSGTLMDNNGIASANNGFYAWLNASANKIQFSQRKGISGQSDYIITTNASVNDGSWHFLVHTWDGTTGTNKVITYFDGAQDNTATAVSAVNNTPTFNLRIGADANATPGNYYNGYLDDVFVTATILSATQIQQLYVAGKEALNNKYRVKLASDTVNQLAGSINVVKGVAASDQYIFTGTNTTGADDGILSRVLLRGDVTDKSYDESSTDPLIIDNDINSVAVSKDGAYIVVGTDDQGITIIHNGVAGNRLRSGGKVQGPSKRPSN